MNRFSKTFSADDKFHYLKSVLTGIGFEETDGSDELNGSDELGVLLTRSPKKLNKATHATIMNCVGNGVIPEFKTLKKNINALSKTASKKKKDMTGAVYGPISKYFVSKKSDRYYANENIDAVFNMYCIFNYSSLEMLSGGVLSPNGEFVVKFEKQTYETFEYPSDVHQFFGDLSTDHVFSDMKQFLGELYDLTTPPSTRNQPFHRFQMLKITFKIRTDDTVLITDYFTFNDVASYDEASYCDFVFLNGIKPFYDFTHRSLNHVTISAYLDWVPKLVGLRILDYIDLVGCVEQTCVNLEQTCVKLAPVVFHKIFADRVSGINPRNTKWSVVYQNPSGTHFAFEHGPHTYFLKIDQLNFEVLCSPTTEYSGFIATREIFLGTDFMRFKNVNAANVETVNGNDVDGNRISSTLTYEVTVNHKHSDEITHFMLCFIEKVIGALYLHKNKVLPKIEVIYNGKTQVLQYFTEVCPGANPNFVVNEPIPDETTEMLLEWLPRSYELSQSDFELLTKAHSKIAGISYNDMLMNLADWKNVYSLREYPTLSMMEYENDMKTIIYQLPYVVPIGSNHASEHFQVYVMLTESRLQLLIPIPTNSTSDIDAYIAVTGTDATPLYFKYDLDMETFEIERSFFVTPKKESPVFGLFERFEQSVTKIMIGILRIKLKKDGYVQDSIVIYEPETTKKLYIELTKPDDYWE